jgi:beta-lactamase class A
MEVAEVFRDLGVSGTAAVLDLESGATFDVAGDDLVSPASVMKIQVALAVADACVTGKLDAREQRTLHSERRTPGPVGISLMQDEVWMSIRDLSTLMMTISDNVATDHLIDLLGLDAVNAVTIHLGLTHTRITSNLADMLDAIAVQLGFADFQSLARHDPERDGPPTDAQLRRQLGSTTAFDPRQGTRTTANETTRLLGAIWNDTAATADACATVRDAMNRQLTRHRIAAGYRQPVTVAAKSGGLLGVVRNEAGVVTYPDGQAYAVAVFTRKPPHCTTDPADIDIAIGQVAHSLTERLRATG